MGVNQSYFDRYVSPTEREIDQVNVFEFESGMDVELTNLGGEINPENIKKAQAKVISNLKKDPAYYTNMLAAESVKLVGEWGSGKKPGTRNTAKSAEAVKAEVKTPKDSTTIKDKANEMKVAKKDVKSNVRKDSKVKNPNNPGKVASMTQTPKKAKGAKMMAMPGKEKKVALKENFSGPDISIEEKLRKNAPIKDYVKDFETSKAPQFKGKSVEKKRNMAIAAHAQKNPKHPMSEAGKKRPSDEETEAAWEKYRADKKAKGEPIMNVGKTTDINKRRIQNNEDVQVKDSRTIRLTPQVVEGIKGMIKEMLYQSKKDPNTMISAKPGDKITTDPDFQNKFKPLS